MIWKLLLGAYLGLHVVTTLLQRRLGRELATHKRLVAGIFFMLVRYPIGLLVAYYNSPQLAIGWTNFFYLLVGSAIFPIITVLALKASKDIDAGRYTILSNIQPIVTIVAATLILNETLNAQQMLGAGIIIASAFLITSPHLLRRGKINATGVTTALLVFLLMGPATVYERWMLSQIGYGAYLVIGWGIQSLWMIIIAWPERKHLRTLPFASHGMAIWSYAVASSIKGVCFVVALKLSGNAALFSAFASFGAILAVPAAYVFLKERDWLWLKIGAAIISSIGLAILTTA